MNVKSLVASWVIALVLLSMVVLISQPKRQPNSQPIPTEEIAPATNELTYNPASAAMAVLAQS